MTRRKLTAGRRVFCPVCGRSTLVRVTEHGGEFGRCADVCCPDHLRRAYVEMTEREVR